MGLVLCKICTYRIHHEIRKLKGDFGNALDMLVKMFPKRGLGTVNQP